MKKFWNKLISHYKKDGKWRWGAIISDVLFYGLLISLIFPASRTFVISNIQRVTMLAPSKVKKDLRLKRSDYKFYFRDLQGNVHSLEEYKGKVIFINLWATWCAPCLAEMPALQDLYNQFRNNPQIVFLFITTEDLNHAQNFLIQKGYDLPIYQQLSNLPPTLQTNSIPTTYLIAKDGRIVAKAKRASRWNSPKVIELIQNLINE